GQAQVAVLLQCRASLVEGQSWGFQCLRGGIQQLLVPLGCRSLGTTPDRFVKSLGQAAVGQMLQGQEITMAGEQIAALAMERLRGCWMCRVANGFGVRGRRV